MTPRSIILYSLYALVMFAVLSVMLFPAQLAGLHVSRFLSSLDPGVAVSVKAVEPDLPMSIRLIDTRILGKEMPPVHLDTLRVTPDIWSMFTRLKTMGFHGGSGTGTLEGSVSAALNLPASDFDATLKLTDFIFSDVTYASAGTVLGLSGVVDGNLSLGCHQDQGLRGTGTYRVSRCFVKVLDPIFNPLGISELKFKTIDITLTMEGTKLIVQEINAQGTEMNLSAKGLILVKLPFGLSTVLLKGHVQPNPSYVKKLAGISSVSMLFDDSNRQGIPFTVTGTVGEAKVGL
ncbi:MAG: type II secretion system protein GspN [Pseudomonadota bacterium]